MSESKVEQRRISWWLWIGQILAVPLVCFGASVFALRWAGLSNFDTLTRELASDGAHAAFGLTCGLLVQRWLPRSRSSGGLWVWILPLCVVAWYFIPDLARGQQYVWSDYFSPSRVYQNPFLFGLEWGIYTLPAIACVFYSLAMLPSSRRSSAPAI